MNFEIISRNEYRIVFYDQEFDKKGWMFRYTVKLECPVMSGYVLVENPPYGHSPLSLYRSIQNEWRGWDGEKSWGSIEGEFDLTAVSDRTGHITLSARIRTRFSAPSSELEMDYIIEAGQMDQIVRRAEKFFKT